MNPDQVQLHHFMLQDLAGSLLGVIVFTAVLFAPGFLIGYASDLFSFRRLRFSEQSLWAVTLSFCTAPLLAYLLSRVAGLTALGWAFGLSAICLVVLLWSLRRDATWSRGERRTTALLTCGWTAFVLLMLVDFQLGHRLYFSVVTADQSYRIAFTEAVARSGIPPANPLYFASGAAPMHYYYFWYVLCAAVMKLGHVSARAAFNASSIWAGFGLLTVTSLFTRHFFHWEPRRRWLALGLLAVTGADLLPALGNAILQPSLNGDIEWWSVEPIDAWPDSLLWVPHHVAAVLCCLAAFLLLWRLREPHRRRTSTVAMALAGTGFASAFGLSTYVAVGFALLVLTWIAWFWFTCQPNRLPLLKHTATAAAISAVLTVPFLHEVLRTTPAALAVAGATMPPHVLNFSVRNIIDSGLLSGLPIFAHVNANHPALLDQSLRLLLLLPGLVMELGLYGFVLALLVLAGRRAGVVWDSSRRSALFLTLAGLALSLFISSSIISNNDFGYRVVMLPMFFLGLLTADLLGCWSSEVCSPVLKTKWRSRSAMGLLALGVAGTAYGAVLLRVWLPLESERAGAAFVHFPEDAYSIRSLFSTLDGNAFTQAVIAFRPPDAERDRGTAVMTTGDFYQRLLVLNADHQMLNAEGKCAVHFGGSPAACRAIQIGVTDLYAVPAPSVESARNFCTQFGVDYLLSGYHDPSWNSETGWPAKLPVLASTSGFRLLACRRATGDPVPARPSR